MDVRRLPLRPKIAPDDLERGRVSRIGNPSHQEVTEGRAACRPSKLAAAPKSGVVDACGHVCVFCFPRPHQEIRRTCATSLSPRPERDHHQMIPSAGFAAASSITLVGRWPCAGFPPSAGMIALQAARHSNWNAARAFSVRSPREYFFNRRPYPRSSHENARADAGISRALPKKSNGLLALARFGVPSRR